MSEYRISNQDQQKIAKFARPTSAHLSLRDPQSANRPSPMEKIGRAMKRTYISSAIVFVAGVSGLVHDRLTNTGYEPVDLHGAILETGHHIQAKMGLYPSYMRPESYEDKHEQIVQSDILDLEPAEFFTKLNVQTPGVGQILAENGIHWIGGQYIETMRPDHVTTMSPESLKELVVEVARMRGWDFRSSIAMMEPALSAFKIASQVCQEGTPAICQTLEIRPEEQLVGSIQFDSGSAEMTILDPSGNEIEKIYTGGPSQHL